MLVLVYSRGTQPLQSHLLHTLYQQHASLYPTEPWVSRLSLRLLSPLHPPARASTGPHLPRRQLNNLHHMLLAKQ